MKPSEEVLRKFVEVVDHEEWEVLSHDGWRTIKSSNKTIPYDVYQVILENGMTLECADNHILITDDFDEVYAIDSIGKTLNTINGPTKVISVNRIRDSENMYDLSIDGDHLFYTNDILSHNTVSAAAYILWCVLFNKKYNIAILANKAEQAREILERIQESYELLPKWIQQGVLVWNKGRIVLENGSKIGCHSTSSSSIRGKSVNLLYLDEFAHIEPNLQNYFFTSVYPTISSGKKTKIIITSTPKGYELFAKMWMDAEAHKNTYVPITAHWSEVPGRDEKWREETIKNTSEEQFRQEFEVEFLGSSDTLVSANAIRLMRNGDVIHEHDGMVSYQEPISGHIYMIVVDVSRGVGGDYSAFSVFDITDVPYSQVARYRNNLVNPLIFPNYIHETAKAYNDAYILVETNDLGQQVVDILVNDLESESVLMTGQAGPKGQALGIGHSMKFGVKTSTPVKRIGCATLKMLLENQKLTISDFETISELTHFIRKGGSYEAEAGKHDDLVMTLVLFAWATTFDYFKEIANSDVRQSLLHDYERKIEEDLTPFGFYDDGIENTGSVVSQWG